jgi:ribonuclease D
MPTELITTDKALRELCEHLAQQRVIAVDTEFHRERTFFAQLALVQVATDERVVCIDPLSGVDPSPFDAILTDPNITKVFHAGRQDLEIFFDRLEAVPAPVFDTQIAASLVGHGDQLAYGVLVQKIVGASLKKLHARTDWMRRPLDEAVLEYAALDVEHLLAVYRSLRADLEALGRLSWLDEEQAPLLDPATYVLDEEDAWTKVKGTGKLKGVDCVVAQRLAGWREAKARELDRPRRRVLSDEAIVDLARQRPKDDRQLDRMRSVDRDLRNKHGKALLAIVKDASALPKETWPATREGTRQAPVDGALIDALAAVLAVRGREAKVSPQVIGTRADLTRVALGEDDVALLQGWRGELVGDALRAFLDGRVKLTVHGGELVLDGAA